MSTFATDPNEHLGTAYGGGQPARLTVSRDLAEPGTVRLDIWLEDGEPAEGIVLPAGEALDLASHLSHAAVSHAQVRCGAQREPRSTTCCLRAGHLGNHLDADGERWT